MEIENGKLSAMAKMLIVRERQLQTDAINQDVSGQVWYRKYFRVIESCSSEIIRRVETIAERNL